MSAPGEYAIVVSDMRMPVMSGSVFLREAARAPDATRILLTGYTDLDAAVSVVNEGQLFRFLTKPCPRDELLAACIDGVEQHRLRTAERVVLEQTLKGSVQALAGRSGARQSGCVRSQRAGARIHGTLGPRADFRRRVGA